MRRAALTALVALIATGAPSPAAVTGAPPPRAASLLVMVRPGAQPPAVPGAGPARLVSRALGAWELTLPSRTGATALAAALRRRPGVLAAQPNWRLAGAQGSNRCTTAPPAPEGYQLGAIRVTGVPVPDTTPPVAVLDTGLDVTAPEFGGRILKPFNVFSQASDVSDRDGHGTQVAGVLAAAPGAVRGVSPSSPLVPVKLLDSLGETDAAGLIHAIDAAVERGARVLNISAAGPASATSAADDAVVTIALARAYASGAIVVASAGNEGSAGPDVPSAYPHVLSVAATDAGDLHADFSNSGRSIDLSAPGVDLVSTAPAALCPTGYAIATGTSFSAPLVSGAAALVERLRPELSTAQVFEQLQRTARDAGPAGWDPQFGFGILDVGAAVTAPAPADDPGEVDDDVRWITGARAPKHPPLLTPRTRVGDARARASVYNDPVDLYRLRLVRGDLLTVRLRSAPGGNLALGLWDAKTGQYDLTNGRTRHLIRSADRPGPLETLTTRIKASGTYYVSAIARHADGPDTTYALRVRRR